MLTTGSSPARQLLMHHGDTGEATILDRIVNLLFTGKLPPHTARWKRDWLAVLYGLSYVSGLVALVRGHYPLAFFGGIFWPLLIRGIVGRFLDFRVPEFLWSSTLVFYTVLTLFFLLAAALTPT